MGMVMIPLIKYVYNVKIACNAHIKIINKCAKSVQGILLYFYY